MEKIVDLPRCLYGRFSSARNNNEQAQKQWAAVESGQVVGASKYATKAKMLAAFIADPSLGDRYMQVTVALNWSEDMARSTKWMCQKQFYDLFGESEVSPTERADGDDSDRTLVPQEPERPPEEAPARGLRNLNDLRPQYYVSYSTVLSSPLARRVLEGAVGGCLRRCWRVPA